MPFIEFSSRAPCGFLIIQEGYTEYDEDHTVLIQTDWDYPSVANRMGWDGKLHLNIECPCDEDSDDFTSLALAHIEYLIKVKQNKCQHRGTDGTVDCPECGASTSDFISAAIDHIHSHEGESFPDLDDYF